MRIKYAAQTRHGARDDKGKQLDLRRVDAERGSAQLVVLHGAHEVADRRSQNDMHQQHARPSHGDEREIVRVRAQAAVERRHAEAQIAAREVVGGAEQNAIGLRERPGGDREVDGAHVEHQPAQHITGAGRGQVADRDADPQRRLQVINEQTGDVGADARKGVLGKRELAGKAGQQVPACGQDHVVGADGENVQHELAGDERGDAQEHANDDRDARNAPPFDEGTPALCQPSRHSRTSCRTRASSNSCPAPSAFTVPRLSMYSRSASGSACSTFCSTSTMAAPVAFLAVRRIS